MSEQVVVESPAVQAPCEYGEALERHVMVFSDIEIEVDVDGEGNAWVNFNRDGDLVTSFTFENWADIARFVKRHATGEGS